MLQAHCNQILKQKAPENYMLFLLNLFYALTVDMQVVEYILSTFIDFLKIYIKQKEKDKVIAIAVDVYVY